MKTAITSKFNPLKYCALCLYRVGFGGRTIEALTGCNRSLVIKWAQWEGIKRTTHKKSRRYQTEELIRQKEETRRKRQAEREERRRKRINEKSLMAPKTKKTDEELREAARKRYKDNKAWIEYQRKERMKDPCKRMIVAMRLRTWKTITQQSGVKSKSWTRELLGCGKDKLIRHLQSKFKKGMSFENYGKEWEVDHIMPCSRFDLTKEDEQRRCFHFTNLQPLWKTENRRKHNKLPHEQRRLRARSTSPRLTRIP